MAGALAVVVLVLLGLGTVPASATPRESDLVGLWDMHVTIYDADPPSHVYLDCTLSPDHLLACVSRPPRLSPRGVWNVGRGNAFSFWITHYAYLDGNGNAVGSLNALHLGRFTRNSFDTTAYTVIDLDDGSPWIGPVQVKSEASRIR